MNDRAFGWPALALASTLALTACGGSGDSSPPPPPPAGSTLTLTGVVSVGPAVASAPVQITCATGTAAATTAADGSYSAGIASGALPCVLRASTSTGSLHSVAAGSASATSATANITPLTELVTANVAAGSPDALYTGFDAAAQAKVTTSTVATGVASTTAALAGNVNLDGGNPLTDKLVVSTSSTTGNAANQAITQLTQAITATQTTLAAVTTAVATATPTSPPVIPTLASTATTCTALRSGLYRALDPHESSDDPATEAALLTVDAGALTATELPGGDGTVTPFTAVPGAPCSYTYANTYGTSTALVSPGGMIVTRSPSITGPIRTSFVVPAQEFALSQLAGTWNFITYDRQYQTPTQALQAHNGSVVLDGAGHFTSGTVCVGLTCNPATADDLPATLTVDPAGGFDAADDVGPDRIFVTSATANGPKTMFILLPGEGGVVVLTEQRTLALPELGSVNTFWDFTVGNGAFQFAPANDANGGASALADYSITITGVDATAQSITRLRASDGRVDTLLVNSPRAGVRNRLAGTNVQPSLQMPLNGFGVTLSTNVGGTSDYLDISINHP